jgi:hypothetical protein
MTGGVHWFAALAPVLLLTLGIVPAGASLQTLGSLLHVSLREGEVGSVMATSAGLGASFPLHGLLPPQPHPHLPPSITGNHRERIS